MPLVMNYPVPVSLSPKWPSKHNLCNRSIPFTAGFTFWSSLCPTCLPALLTCSEFWLTGQMLMLSSRQNEKFCL